NKSENDDGKQRFSHDQLLDGWPYWNTCSSGTPNTSAMRKATSSDGEYLFSSIALTVWRVTPILSASSCCVISLWSKRSRRILFWMVFGMSRVPAVERDLRGEPGNQRREDRAHQQLSHREAGGAGQMQPESEREERAGQQHIERHARGPDVDQPFALV